MLTSVFFPQGKFHGKVSQWKRTTRDAVVAGELKSDEEQTNEEVPAHLEFLGGILNRISKDFLLTVKITSWHERRFDRSSVILKFNVEGKN